MRPLTRIVYNDYTSAFNVCIHERNIQTFVIELYKVVNGVSPNIFEEVFPMKKSTRYCSKFPFETFNVHTTNYGTLSLSYMETKIWSILPKDIKESKTLQKFKNRIKK